MISQNPSQGFYQGVSLLFLLVFKGLGFGLGIASWHTGGGPDFGRGFLDGFSRRMTTSGISWSSISAAQAPSGVSWVIPFSWHSSGGSSVVSPLIRFSYSDSSSDTARKPCCWATSQAVQPFWNTRTSVIHQTYTPGGGGGGLHMMTSVLCSAV